MEKSKYRIGDKVIVYNFDHFVTSDISKYLFQIGTITNIRPHDRLSICVEFQNLQSLSFFAREIILYDESMNIKTIRMLYGI